MIDKVLQLTADALWLGHDLLGEAAEYVEAWLSPDLDAAEPDPSLLTWDVYNNEHAPTYPLPAAWLRTEAERRAGV